MNPVANVTAPAERSVRVSRPHISIAMILCGIVSAAGIGAASAAVLQDDVPSIVVKFNPENLETDRGAHIIYRQIVRAAEEVCPANTDSRFLNSSVRHCREESIARAVMKINNSRLAAIHESASRKG
jgi:UrcA family protein